MTCITYKALEESLAPRPGEMVAAGEAARGAEGTVGRKRLGLGLIGRTVEEPSCVEQATKK